MSLQPSPLSKPISRPSIRKSYLLAVVAVLAIGIDAQAAPVLVFNATSGGTDPNFNQTLGWQFNVVSPIPVTGLGWFAPNNAGLATSHTVGLWSPSGTLLVFATIPAGNVAPLDGQFRTVGIPTIVLPAGAGYIVAGTNTTSNTQRIAFGVNQNIDSRLQFDAAVFSTQPSGFTRPTNFLTTTGFYGPSFSTNPRLGDELAVPEPSTMAIAGLLSIGGFVYLRCRRRAGGLAFANPLPFKPGGSS